MLRCQAEQVENLILDANRLWLFLDYDGTLAEFAETPDHIEVNAEVRDLLAHLVQLPGVKVSVVSGRSLEHIRELVPVQGVLLAGTYGIECQSFAGEDLHRLEWESYRPVLETIKPKIKALIDGRKGYYLEDKGWSLALHARFAAEKEARQVLLSAQDIIERENPGESFTLLGGQKFLEICPAIGNKGVTVEYLLEQYPWPGARLVYLGDDDKDEEAFRVIRDHGGISIRIGLDERESLADCQIDNPQEARRWLKSLIKRRENGRRDQ